MYQKGTEHIENIIGHKKSLGVTIADVYTSIPVTNILELVIVSQLESDGHQMVAQGSDFMLSGEIVAFGVKTSLNINSWDAIGFLDVIIEVYYTQVAGEPVIRRYQAEHTPKTVLGPTTEHFEQVMRECLEDLQEQIASDAELAKLFYDNRPKYHSND